MTVSSSFRQTAPDRLEFRSGGGCISLFGIPFLAAGVFLILMALQIVPVSNAEELPLWAWPVMLLMGLCFLAFSSWLVFGRTRLTVDRSAGHIAKEWRLLLPLRRDEHSLLDYRAISLNYSSGDSDSAATYDVTLQSAGGRADMALSNLADYGPALAQAASVAQFMGLPLVDNTTNHAVVIDAAAVGRSLAARLAGGDENVFEAVAPPPLLQTEVRVEGQTVCIRIPNPALTPVGLLGYAFPVLILVFFAPPLLRFFGATETQAYVQICASGFLLFFFVILPVLSLLNAFLRSRRGATIVTASPAGIGLEQRGAWRSKTRTIQTAEILGLDYSTSQSSLRSARSAAVQYAAPSQAAGETDEAGLAAAAGTVTSYRWLGRLVRGQGVIIKCRDGFVSFGAGLPDPEIHYLWSLAGRALAGKLAGASV